MNDLTISIGSISNVDGLEECLHTVFSEDDPGFKFGVSLVLNGPQEEHRITQLKTNFPKVDIIRSQNKLGWCCTHNQTLKKFDSRYVLILDDDTLLPKGTLPTMVRFMDTHPEVGIAGSGATFPDGSFQKTYGLFSNLKTEFFHSINLPSFWPERLYKNITSWKDVEWLTGQLLIVRPEAIQQAGFLDEFYYTFGVEPDWCYRIHQAGWKVAHVPDTKIVHMGAELALHINYKKHTSIVRSYVNRFYFFRKYYSRFTFNCLRPLILVGATLRLLKFLFVYVFVAERKREAGQKVKAFLIVIKMAFSPDPCILPAYLQEENNLAQEGL